MTIVKNKGYEAPNLAQNLFRFELTRFIVVIDIY